MKTPSQFGRVGRVTLALLALAFALPAQDVVPNRRKNFQPAAGAPASPYDISFMGMGVSNRWLARAMSTNSAVSDWIDQTNSFHWTQGTVGNQPTNSPLGVRFDNGKFLNSTNVFQDGSLVVAYIFRLDSGLSDAVLAGDTATESRAIGYTDVGAGLVTHPGNFVYGKIKVSAYQDVIMTSSPGPTPTLFTNGVADTLSSGNTWYSFTGSTGYIGKDQQNFYPFLGSLQDLVIFTNTSFTSVNASNWHYFRTNVYGGSP